MKKKPFLLLAISVLALSSCALVKAAASSFETEDPFGSSGESHPGSSNEASSLTSSEAASSVSSAFPSSFAPSVQTDGDYGAFWTYGTAVSLSLSFANAALYALSDYGANYSEKYADVYFPAQFQATVGSDTYRYAEVGVRMKGATSRTVIAASDGTLTDVCHFKLDFGATFDADLYDLALFASFKHDWSSDSAGRKARKKRTFAGMGKLDLKYLPRNQEDQTYSQDIYCYGVFDQNGIAAPKARWLALNLADAKMNENLSYEAVEDIDEDFLDRHLGAAGGDLYKCTQVIFSPSSFSVADLGLAHAVSSSFDASGYANGTRLAQGYIGVEDNYNGYHPNYDLKTNDDGESSDFSKLAKLMNVAYSLRYAQAPYSLLDATIDISEFLKFEAVSYLLGNFDDQRNNYNNYYAYFRPTDGKAIYIPYDWDYSLGAHKTADISGFGPFHQNSTHDSKDANSLYWDTILTNSDLAYALGASQSQTAMQNEYKADISAAMDLGAITYASYTAFLSTLANRLSSSQELSDVKAYMSTKNGLLSNY
jgi:spore coat protein CotH